MLARLNLAILAVLAAALAVPVIGVTPAHANNPGDPLFCQPQEGVGYLITNSGSDVWAVDTDCFNNFNPGVPATLTSQSVITTSQGGTLTLTVTPSGGNYVYTPPTAGFVGVDSFSYTVTTEWNGAGGSGSGPGNTSHPGGPYTFTGPNAIQLNVLNSTDTMTGLKNTAVAVPLPAGSIAGPCTNLGNFGLGPPAGAITGCVTAVSDLPPTGFPLSLQPSHGILIRNGATGLTYTPTAGYYGLDTFGAYVLGANTDGPHALSSGEVTYTVAVMTTIDTLQTSYNASQFSSFLLPAFTGGTLLLNQPGATYSQAFTLDNSATNTIDQGGNAATFSGVFSGGNLNIANSGTGGSVTFTAANTYTGTTTVNAGATLNLAGAGSIATSSRLTDNGTFDISATTSGASVQSLAGSGTVALGNRLLTLTNANDTFAGTIAGNGGLTLAGGVEVLTGANTYLGPTTINGGTLVVNGSITDPTVNSGGLLTGTGAVGSTIVNSGGVLAPGSTTPGTSLTINGSLAFASGALYVVTLNSTTTTFANVTGTAALGGTVQAVFGPGTTNVKQQYDILHSAALGSTTFAGIALTNLPNFSASLSYSPTDVFLNITSSLGAGAGLNTNQQNVANGINNLFNSGGSLPAGFLHLFGLSGSALGGALSQVSGEIGTSSQQTTFQAMSQFLNLLTDPFLGRGAGINGSNSAAAPTAYAEESSGASAYAERKTLSAERDAYAMFTKAPLANTYQPHWSVWASSFGGTETTSGNMGVGSNDMRSSIFGTAAGADYLVSPNTLAGFALAGGGTSFAIGNGLGSGRSDLFQAGAYLRHTSGPAYVSAALAYGWQEMTTDRTVTVAGIDQLRAQFDANAWSGRLEGGYRFVAPFAGGIGVTPYGGAQFTTFDLPSYTEQAILGSNQFALGYGAKTVTDARSELGIRTDQSYVVQASILTLRSRFAWAHDFDPDRTDNATFQSLPGASFVVNGARQAADSALTTLSAEWRWTNRWSVAATFEGEFSNVTQSYAGKGVVRYTW